MKNAQDVRFGLASWVTIVPSHLLILEKKGEVAERKYFSAKKAEAGINKI